MGCSDKAIESLDDDGERRTLWGKKKPTLVRMVLAMQANWNSRKGCLLFEVHISSDKGKEVEDEEVVKTYLFLHQF